MISYLRGTVHERTDSSVILDVNGVGYEVFAPYRTLCRLERSHEEVELYTYLQVTEDHFSLFGFLNRQDLKTFKLLIGVSGIGPKGALSILSNMTTEDLILAVVSEDSKTIAKTPGIGAKTAAKLVLELKDKFSLSDTLTAPSFDAVDSGSVPANGALSIDNETRNDAVAALTALGYSASDALKAVRMVEPEEGMTSDRLLKLALKNIR